MPAGLAKADRLVDHLSPLGIRHPECFGECTVGHEVYRSDSPLQGLTTTFRFGSGPPSAGAPRRSGPFAIRPRGLGRPRGPSWPPPRP